MKELFPLLAEYNARTNVELLDILERKLPPGQVAQDAGAYYGSILGILNHILAADTVWLLRFADTFAGLAPLLPRLPQIDLASDDDNLWPSFATYRPVREEVDRVIRDALRLLPEDAYRATLRYRNSQGEERNKLAWRAFLHLFNHQTHHRGQISVLLDQLKVENDVSNLIWKF